MERMKLNVHDIAHSYNCALLRHHLQMSRLSHCPCAHRHSPSKIGPRNSANLPLPLKSFGRPLAFSANASLPPYKIRLWHLLPVLIEKMTFLQTLLLPTKTSILPERPPKWVCMAS